MAARDRSLEEAVDRGHQLHADPLSFARLEDVGGVETEKRNEKRVEESGAAAGGQGSSVCMVYEGF